MRLVAIQHRLPSIAWLFSEIRRANLCTRISLVTKPYSAIPFRYEDDLVVEVPSVDTALQGFRGPLLALDEGGALHRAIADGFAGQCAGIEQTTFGLTPHWKYPTVLVCRSAAKLLFESQIIVRGILRKLDSLHVLLGKNVGVIGLGALGRELARALLNRGIPTLGAEVGAVPVDLRPITVSLNELLNRCDVLLGCTGTDAFRSVDLGTVFGSRVFISCASSDVEYHSIIRQLPSRKRFVTVQGPIGSMYAYVLNGGFPINFDRDRERELFEEIILTRRLVLEGLVQAKSMIGGVPGGFMLDPAMQLQVVNEWLEQVPDRHTLSVPAPLSEAFFRKHSEGELVMSKKPYTLHSTTPLVLAKMRTHTEPYSVEVTGLAIIVLPNVWSPAYDWSSLFHVENFPEVRGLDFLEIGCGTGVISVFAARNGARRVVAVDVNPEAVRNTHINFERIGAETAEAYVSDIFSSVRGSFDVVTWNAPYHGSKPTDILERGCADEDYHDIRKFFSDVDQYLNPGGLIVFGFSESGDLPLLETLIADHGYRVRRKLSDWRQGYNCVLLEILRAKRAVEVLRESPF